MIKITDYKKNIRLIAVIFLVLFSAVLSALYRFVIFESERAVTSPYNKRLGALDDGIERGEILDRKGAVLARSVRTDDGFVREYAYGEIFAHALGYMEAGKYGVESKYNFELQKLTLESWQRLRNILFDTPLEGDDLILTLDLELQTLAYNLLKGKKGAIVALEPSTGKILAQVSYPAFDPNTLADDWSVLSGDTENSPLFNRASQGLYPPGSTFKIITYIAGLESEDGFLDIRRDCTGEAVFEDSKIRCFNSTVHGNININDAFAVSCNSAFANVGITAGVRRLTEVAEMFLFNKPYSYPLDYSVSSFTIEEDADIKEIAQTSIGQGKTLVTPLHLALIASTIANNGVMMQPYIVDYSSGYNGRTKNKQVPDSVAALISPETAFLLTEIMVGVVRDGTARGLQIDGVDVAAKTGTAENSSGDDHGLIVAFAPSQNPEIALAVVLENSGGSAPCQVIAREMIEKALSQ